MILVIDGAMRNPWKLRRRALESSYDDYEGVYRRVSVQPIGELEQAVSDVVPGVACSGTGFRLNYGGEMPNNFVHADIDRGDLAAILFLSLPEHCHGGTAFWAHRDTGIERLPDSEPTRGKLVSDWGRKDAWSLRDKVDMVFNRLIMYPTELFHSRWPWPAFGSGPADGRLCAVGFFSYA